MNKKFIYISLFVVLGILLQFILHAVLEIWYINLLTSNFAKYSLGFTWDEWYVVHHVFTAILVILGIIFGYFTGNYSWKKVYKKRKQNAI